MTGVSKNPGHRLLVNARSKPASVADDDDAQGGPKASEEEEEKTGKSANPGKKESKGNDEKRNSLLKLMTQKPNSCFCGETIV